MHPHADVSTVLRASLAYMLSALRPARPAGLMLFLEAATQQQASMLL